MKLPIACVATCLLLAATPRATTVIPPSFTELVGEAELVFEGEVIETKSRMASSGGEEAIFTDVTFRVNRALKGAAGSTVVLEFLGGEVGDQGLRVAGMPRFARGDRDVIFAITSQRLMSPLVRMMYGRVRVSREGSPTQESVRLFDGTPLRDTAALGREGQPLLSQTKAMSLAAFESAVVAEIARQAAQKGRRP